VSNMLENIFLFLLTVGFFALALIVCNGIVAGYYYAKQIMQQLPRD
jgi:uncharacterized membrane protein